MNAVKFAAFALLAAAGMSASAGGYLKMDRDFAPGAGIENSPLYRKKIALLGDSYVQNHHRPIEETWHCQLAQKYQMHYYNFGRNGNMLAFDTPKRGTPMVKRYTELPRDADYVVVIAGHNDASGGLLRLNGDSAPAEVTPEIEAKRAQMLAEFAEKSVKLMDGLKKHCPKAKIAFISPWKVDTPFFPKVTAILEESAKKTGVAFYNAAELSGIDPNDPEFRKKYFQGEKDTAHLNKKGQDLVLPKMEAFLLSI